VCLKDFAAAAGKVLCFGQRALQGRFRRFSGWGTAVVANNVGYIYRLSGRLRLFLVLLLPLFVVPSNNLFHNAKQ
jgi:hypothetical protein